MVKQKKMVKLQKWLKEKSVKQKKQLNGKIG